MPLILLTTIEDYGKFCECIKSTGLTKEVYAEMTSNQTVQRKTLWFLGFEIYDLGNEEYLVSRRFDKGVKPLCLFCKNKARTFDFYFDTGVSIYEPLLTHYLGENGQKIFDIETK
jgi:hypothetical protein